MNNKFGTRIKELRNAAGMTQTELAEKVGVSKSVISAYEKGIRNPSHKIVELIAKVFGTSVISFYDRGYFKNQAVTADITDLTSEQQKIIFSLINQFKKDNKENKK